MPSPRRYLAGITGGQLCGICPLCLLHHDLPLFLQSNLLQRFQSLLKCHAELDDYVAVSATLGKVMESLPIAQLQSPATVKLLTKQWVWLKRSAVAGWCLDLDLDGRSLLHLLDNHPLKLQVLYLEQELCLYLESARPLHSALVAVLADLVSLHTQPSQSAGGELPATHYAIHLAGVCLDCSQQCAHRQRVEPRGLLNKALRTLASMDHAPNHTPMVQQGLATAHLWKALMVFKQNMRYVFTCAQVQWMKDPPRKGQPLYKGH